MLDVKKYYTSFCKLSRFLYQSCFCGSYLSVQGPQLLLISSQQKRFSYIKDRDSIEQQVFERDILPSSNLETWEVSEI